VTNDNPDIPMVTLGDAVRTTVMAYEEQIALLDDRDQAYAIDLCRRLFGFMRTWAALDTEELEREDREAVIVLRKLYTEVREMHAGQPDRTALALALGKIVEAGYRYGLDIRDDAGGQEPYLYPEESIVRDVAAQMVGEHIQRMITMSVPAVAAALLITRSGEMGRQDLVTLLLEDGSAVRTRMLAMLGNVLPKMKHEAIALVRAGTGK
jgi:hypothetical protein